MTDKRQHLRLDPSAGVWTSRERASKSKCLPFGRCRSLPKKQRTSLASSLFRRKRGPCQSALFFTYCGGEEENRET